MKINKDEFKKRMRRLVTEIEMSGLGHDPVETMRVVAQIRAWADTNPQFVDSLLYELPEPASTLVTHDPGFLVADNVLIGETEFYLCEDCRFPMTSSDEAEGCPICGDNFSDSRKVVLGDKLPSSDVLDRKKTKTPVKKGYPKTYTRIAITSSNIGIHQEPLNELLKLPEIYKGSVKSVLKQWYNVSDISMEIYISTYLRYIQEVHPQVKGLKAKMTETTIKRATDTPIVGRTTTLAIRQGPVNDILKLENATYDTVRPVLHKWYPRASEKSLEDYVWLYLRFLRNANYIDADGHILKKPAIKEEPEQKKSASEIEKKTSMPATTEKPAITAELKKELEIARGKPTGDTKIKESENARKSPVVESTPSLAIRQGPIDDILKLTIANRGTAFPVLRIWYPNASESTLKDYVYRYLRYLHSENYIDDEGHILKKPREGATEVEDEGPDLIHPVREDLTVVTIKGKVEIYLEPLNEILKLERIDDMRLHKILVKYYDVSRVSFLVAIKGMWMEFLKEDGYIDAAGKTMCKELVL